MNKILLQILTAGIIKILQEVEQHFFRASDPTSGAKAAPKNKKVAAVASGEAPEP